jgi:hypothetical protein
MSNFVELGISYITNKSEIIRLPNEPGMLEWLQENYPYSGYYIVEVK